MSGARKDFVTGVGEAMKHARKVRMSPESQETAKRIHHSDNAHELNYDVRCIVDEDLAIDSDKAKEIYDAIKARFQKIDLTYMYQNDAEELREAVKLFIDYVYQKDTNFDVETMKQDFDISNEKPKGKLRQEKRAIVK